MLLLFIPEEYSPIPISNNEKFVIFLDQSLPGAAEIHIPEVYPLSQDPRS